MRLNYDTPQMRRPLCCLVALLLPTGALAQVQTSPDKYCLQGLAKANAGDFDGALADYNAAIKTDVLYADAYTLRGHARWIKGDLKGALADLDVATRLNPKNAVAFEVRGIALQSIAPDKALPDFDQAIKLNPSEPTAYYDRAAILAAKGDAKSAIASVSRAIELRPGYAKAYAFRAEQEFHAGDLKASEADDDKAHDLDAAYPGSQGPSWFTLTSAAGKADATPGDSPLLQRIIPPANRTERDITVAISIKNLGFVDFQMPKVEGVALGEARTATNYTKEQGSVFTKSFTLTPQRSGDFTIPAFDITVPHGPVLKVEKMTFHVAEKHLEPDGPSPFVSPPEPVLSAANASISKPDTTANATELDRYKARFYRLVATRWFPKIAAAIKSIPSDTVRIQYTIVSDGAVSAKPLTVDEDFSQKALDDLCVEAIRETSPLEPFNDLLRQQTGKLITDQFTFSITSDYKPPAPAPAPILASPYTPSPSAPYTPALSPTPGNPPPSQPARKQPSSPSAPSVAPPGVD